MSAELSGGTCSWALSLRGGREPLRRGRFSSAERPFEEPGALRVFEEDDWDCPLRGCDWDPRLEKNMMGGCRAL